MKLPKIYQAMQTSWSFVVFLHVYLTYTSLSVLAQTYDAPDSEPVVIQLTETTNRGSQLSEKDPEVITRVSPNIMTAVALRV